jgi:hypothetical protein
MYEIMFRRLPFGGDTGETILKLRENKRPPLERSISKLPECASVIQLMKSCWAEKFDERPLFPQILHDLQNSLQVYNKEELAQQISQLEAVLPSCIPVEDESTLK